MSGKSKIIKDIPASVWIAALSFFFSPFVLRTLERRKNNADKPTRPSLSMAALLGCFMTLAIGAFVIIKLPTDKSSSPDARRIPFAAATLTGMLLVFIYSMSLYADAKTSSVGKDIFEGCLKVLSPIATLVVGFWFGSKKE